MNSAHATAADRYRDWIPLIDLAAREVFELMMSSKLEDWKDADISGLDTTSMVGLAGRLCGVMSVRCDGEAAVLMTSKMLGVDLDKVGPEVTDALGEICNMVAGNFKNKITGLAEGCMLSPPTVITGSDYTMRSMADSPPLLVGFRFEGLPVAVSLEIHT